MINKTSSEIQEIFGLCRDDVKRLEKDGVINPKKNGQGKASMYGEEDLNRLLDIKIYLLGGYRISDMKRIITDGYDSGKSISEQIHLYKKRIQVLEFIKNIKEDINKMGRLKTEPVDLTGKISTEKIGIPEYGSKEYYEVFWGFITLVFIVDFMSQKESLKEESGLVLKRAMTAFNIVEKISNIPGMEFNRDELINELIDMASTPISDEEEIKKSVKEIMAEYLRDKEEFIEEITRAGVNPIADAMDSQSGIVYKEMMNHFITFVLDYFMDEEELYCVYVNFRKFVNGLDKEALVNGIIRLPQERSGILIRKYD